MNCCEDLLIVRYVSNLTSKVRTETLENKYGGIFLSVQDKYCTFEHAPKKKCFAVHSH